MSIKMKKAFAREMQNMDAAGLLRTETAITRTNDRQIHVTNEKSLLDFVGNDLLGWSYNEEIRETAFKALEKYGTGNTSSRVAIGTLDIYKELEHELTLFLGIDDCIVFPSIYLANLGLFESLTNQKDTIFIDEMSNPGLFDAARLANANIVTYKHLDSENLEYHLKCSLNSRFRIMVSDAVFATSGNCADIHSIEKFKTIYDAISVVDDSYGVGILGKKGGGTFSHLQEAKKSELITGSFAVALGNVSGGFVGGDKDLVNWLRHTSRSYLISEPISPINASIVLKAVNLLSEDQSSLDRLHENAKYLKVSMLKKAWKVIHNDHPFVSVVVGTTLRTQKVVDFLYENDILVSGLCYPNTPEGSALVRLNVTADHTQEQLDHVVAKLEKAFKKIE